MTEQQSIAEIDSMLQEIWSNFRVVPDTIYINELMYWRLLEPDTLSGIAWQLAMIYSIVVRTWWKNLWSSNEGEDDER